MNSPTPLLQKALSLVQERTKKLSEISGFIRFFFEPDETLPVNAALYTHSKMGTSAQTAHESLVFSQTIITEISEESWNLETVKTAFLQKITEAGYKNGFILYPLRVALSGEEFSPGTFELLEFFGKKRSLTRIENALQQLTC